MSNFSAFNFSQPYLSASELPLPDGLQVVIPMPPPPVAEAFQVHQVTFEFYREVETREAFERYCRWYDQTAATHRQDLLQMQNEPNLLRWFLR